MTDHKSRKNVTLRSAVAEAMANRKPRTNEFAEDMNRLQAEAAANGRLGMFWRRPTARSKPAAADGQGQGESVTCCR